MSLNFPVVGVFDSGLGGLTVVRELKRRCPYLDIIYLGDTAHLPYGTKSRRAVTSLAFQNAQFLISQGVSMMIVACHTASAMAGSELGETLSVPVFEVVEPSCQLAVKLSAARRVGVIATPSTIASRTYEQRLRQMAPDLEVVVQSCPLFVPLVEEGWIDNLICRDIMKEYLNVFLDKEIDVLVLGCTHYPMLKDGIQAIVGSGVCLIDPAELMAEQAEAWAKHFYSPSWDDYAGQLTLYVTDWTERFSQMACSFLNEPAIDIKLVNLDAMKESMSV